MSADGEKRERSLRDRDLAAEGLLLLEGSFLVERGISAALDLVELICVPEAQGRWREASRGACPLRVLPEPELAAVAGFPFHRGVLGLAKRPVIGHIGETEPDGRGSVPEGNILCLWQVTDPENLGALLRSGAALGAQAAILGPGCADPYYPKALRSSMGAALGLPILRAGEIDLGALCAPPRIAVAAVLGGKPLPEAAKGLPPASDVLLFLGNEGWGLPEAVRKACALEVEIPMSGLTDSLNVAASGAILMWELFGKGAVRAAG